MAIIASAILGALATRFMSLASLSLLSETVVIGGRFLHIKHKPCSVVIHLVGLG